MDEIQENSIENKPLDKCIGIKKYDAILNVVVCPLRNECLRFMAQYEKNQMWIDVPYDTVKEECKQFIKIKKV